MRSLLKKSFSTKKTPLRYSEVFERSTAQDLQFWKESAKGVRWQKFPETMLRVERENFFRWYPDGKMNITEQCLDINAAERPDQVAFYVESPVTDSRSAISYKELHGRVSRFASSLKSNFNLRKGDPVIIYMPMVIESIVAILACARIGAPHVVVFGGFSAHELSNRIVDCSPKLLICSNVGKEPSRVVDYLQIVNEAISMSKFASMPKIVHQRAIGAPHQLGSNEYDFSEVEKGGTSVSPEILDSNHPLYYLYTSGTTGKPKGIIRDHGGTAVILNNAMKFIFDAQPGQGMFCTSDIGWVLGHSFIIYAPLLKGLRSVLFEGKPVGTPDAGKYWEIVSQHKIDHLYTSPTAIRSIRKQDPDGKLIKKHDVGALKTVTLVGERCDVPTFEWLASELPDKFINDSYWQTETGSPILSNFTGFAEQFRSKPGSATKPLPGSNVKVLNETTGKQCGPGETGVIFVKNPQPPSFMQSILNNDQIYADKYFRTVRGYYNTGDSGMVDEDGYISIMSRVDDVINTAGHRMSTGEMEQAIMTHEKVAEAVVVGVADEIKGEVPVGFVTIKTGRQFVASQVEREVVALIRKEIGPVASFKICHVVPRLPKTRSGKYLRHVVRKMYNRQHYEVPSTIQDIEVVHELQKKVDEILKK